MLGKGEPAAATVRALLADPAALGDAGDREVHERADVAHHAAVGRRDQDHAMPMPIDARTLVTWGSQACAAASIRPSSRQVRDRRFHRRRRDRVEVVRSAVGDAHRDRCRRFVARPRSGRCARDLEPVERHPRRCTAYPCRAPASTRTPTP
jgi:hypothetical protein